MFQRKPTPQPAEAPPRRPLTDDEYNQLIVDWTQRLMDTKGYGWSKAMDIARTLYGGRDAQTGDRNA
mgnify:FL=1